MTATLAVNRLREARFFGEIRARLLDTEKDGLNQGFRLSRQS